MPGNAGYTMLMFHILKEWHHLRDLSRSHRDARDLATFSLRFDFSYFHILLGRGKPCPQMLFSQRFFCRPLLHFPCTVPCKIVLASPTAISSECPLSVSRFRKRTTVLRKPGYIGAHTFDL